MADKYINELTQLSGTPSGTVVIPLFDGTTKHITVTDLMSAGLQLGTAGTKASPGTHLHTGVYTTTTVATDPIFDAAGDLAVGTASDKSARLAVGGTAGMKLVSAPAQATKMAWIPDRFTAGFLIGDATGTATVTNATYGPIEMPFAGTITAARVFSDANGTVSLTFRKQAYSSYVTSPGTATDISGTVPLVLAGTCKAELATLTSWTPGFSAGDLLHCVVASAVTVKELRVSLTGFKADVS